MFALVDDSAPCHQFANGKSDDSALYLCRINILIVEINPFINIIIAFDKNSFSANVSDVTYTL